MKPGMIGAMRNLTGCRKQQPSNTYSKQKKEKESWREKRKKGCERNGPPYLKLFKIYFLLVILLFWRWITTWYSVDLYRRRLTKGNAKDVKNEKPIQLSIRDRNSRCNVSFLKTFLLFIAICITYVMLLYSAKAYNSNHLPSVRSGYACATFKYVLIYI